MFEEYDYMSPEEKEAVRRKAALAKRMTEILNSHGIGLEIHACGCCSGPECTFRYKGESIVDQESEFNFSNLK